MNRGATFAAGVAFVASVMVGGIVGLLWLLDGGALVVVSAAFGPRAGAMVLTGAVAVVGLYLLARVRTRARMIGGPRMVVHTRGNDDREVAAWHESGHARMTKKVGGRVISVTIGSDGSGRTDLRLPRTVTPVQRISVDVAGEVASGTTAGCSSDHAFRDAMLASLPPEVRGRTRRDGYALARRTCTPEVLRADAVRLLERGRLSAW